MKKDPFEHPDLMKGRRLSIEPGTLLQIEIGGIEFRFKSELVGLQPDEFLIIKTPLVPSDAPFGMIKHKLFRGNDIIVRYLSGGMVYGFQSKLMGSISDPTKLLFLEYPKIVEQHDLRSHERVDCLLPGRLKFKDTERPCLVLDISEKGCRCRIKNQKDEKLPTFQVDDQVVLGVKLLDVEGEQVITCDVKNISRDNDELRLGMEFHKIVSNLRDILLNYIMAIKDLS